MPPFGFSVGERKIMNHFVVECLLRSSFTNLASCSSEGPWLKIPTKEASSELTGFDAREIRGAIKDIPVETAQAGNFETQFTGPIGFLPVGHFCFRLLA
jgi:hypothetical protein